MKIATVFCLFLSLHQSFADKKEIPYHVSLLVDGVKFCSGSLISQDTIVTAASCVYKAFEAVTTLGTGSVLDLTGIPFKIASFKVHKCFKNGNFYNIALIKIPPLNTTLYNVSFLKLPEEDVFDDEPLTLGGFDLDYYGIWDRQNVIVNKGYQKQIFYVGPYHPRSPSEKLTGYRNIGSAIVRCDDSGIVLMGIAINNDEEVTGALRVLPFVQWIHDTSTAMDCEEDSKEDSA